MNNFFVNILRFIYRLVHIKGIQNVCFTPGHFYSPIVSVKSIKKREAAIWPDFPGEIEELDLNAEKQLELCKNFESYYSEFNFSSKKGKLRYYFDNIFFLETDAIALYSFIRHFKPQNIVEIGSGFSSALMLDTREQFNLDLNITFIEPYPKRLKSLLTQKDKETVRIYEKKVQDTDLKTIDTLEENDILFIDSTHISKTGSDVNHELFKILPRLKKGVLIHFHDIFYPFEYPKNWVYQGRSWNENYILKAFLMYNKDYEILFFSDYLHKCHPEVFKDMPLCYKNKGGSIWLRKKR